MVGRLGLSAARTLLGVRVAGAVLLGVATLLGPKADPREHWATPPRVTVVAVQEDPADPDEPLDDIDLALLLADVSRRTGGDLLAPRPA